ncbi:MAG TPA: acyltransferase family protein [Actinomycetota bacterium]|nr:acyltransferase family protein [Actinomycetota bacterium]
MSLRPPAPAPKKTARRSPSKGPRLLAENPDIPFRPKPGSPTGRNGYSPLGGVPGVLPGALPGRNGHGSTAPNGHAPVSSNGHAPAGSNGHAHGAANGNGTGNGTGNGNGHAKRVAAPGRARISAFVPAQIRPPVGSGFRPPPQNGHAPPAETAPQGSGSVPAGQAPRRLGRRKRAQGRLRVPSADGFRGLAAIGVVACHCLYAAARPHLSNKFLLHLIVASYVSVDYFFILSGFLLFLPMVAEGNFGSKKAYALRRSARIVPAYYLAVIATLLLLPWVVTVPVHVTPFTRVGSMTLLLHLTFAQHSLGLALGYPEGFFVNGAVWTLAIEVVFYALLPVIAGWYRKHPFVGLGIAEVIAATWRTIGTHGWFPLPHWAGLKSPQFVKEILVTQFPTYTAHFALGMTAAFVFVQIRNGNLKFKIPSLAWVPVEAASLSGVLWWMNQAGARDVAFKSGPFDHWIGTTPVAVCFTVLVLATALAPTWAQFPFTNWISKKLGDVSYGLYLTHLLFVGYALKTLHWTPNATSGDFLKMFAFACGGALIVGSVSYYCMERPIIRWSHRKSKEIEKRAAAERLAGPVLAPAPVLVPTPALEPGEAAEAVRPAVEPFRPVVEPVRPERAPVRAPAPVATPVPVLVGAAAGPVAVPPAAPEFPSQLPVELFEPAARRAPVIDRPAARPAASARTAAGRPAARAADPVAPAARPRSTDRRPAAAEVPEEIPGIVYVEDILAATEPPAPVPASHHPVADAMESSPRQATTGDAEARPPRPPSNGSSGNGFWWAGMPSAQSAEVEEPAGEPAPVRPRSRAWAAR